MPTIATINSIASPSPSTKDTMKRTTRLSIEFQHREVTVTVQGTTLHARDNEPRGADSPAICPVCGSPWLTLAAPADGEVPASLESVHRTLQQSGLHMQISQAGQLRVCQRSFEELKEKL